ncbi:MAG: MFS transporter, partial [Gemmatimonadota bacterium]
MVAIGFACRKDVRTWGLAGRQVKHDRDAEDAAGNSGLPARRLTLDPALRIDLRACIRNTTRTSNTTRTLNANTPANTTLAGTQTSNSNSSPDLATGAGARPTASSSGRALRSAAGIAGLVAVAHFTNDTYSAFLLPLLPRVMDRLGLSIALAATLAMTLSISASLIQPAMGYVADRFGRRPLVIIGPLLSAVFMSSIGVAPTFAVLMGLLVLGGTGSAMFHPPGASRAARVSEGRGSGVRYSIVSFGGATGYAVG